MEGTPCGSRLCRLPGTLPSKAPCSSRNRGPGPPPIRAAPPNAALLSVLATAAHRPLAGWCLRRRDEGGTQGSAPPAQARAAWGTLQRAAWATGEARGPVGGRGSPHSSSAASLPTRAASRAVSTLASLAPSGPCLGCGKPAGSPSAPCSLEQPGGTREHLAGDPAPGSPGPAARTRRGTGRRLSPRREQRAARDPSRGTSASSLQDPTLSRAPPRSLFYWVHRHHHLFQKVQ